MRGCLDRQSEGNLTNVVIWWLCIYGMGADELSFDTLGEGYRLPRVCIEVVLSVSVGRKPNVSGTVSGTFFNPSPPPVPP